ncbi:MAG: tRNA uridine-5-carboxymethylaminomethyl(34) synthesis GTPase MnmE [Prevotella sp.]|nr:tRNA uridine-5-carboxymethylaminomethyl(34) synthesis GTPase MnmE [Prevotella sp.]
MNILNNNTICAPATTAGGAIAIIRISGKDTFTILSASCQLCCNNVAANTIHHTHIISPEGQIIDEVMVAVFRHPHSYTGEDSAEIYCHGSRFIVNEILELLLKNGCRMAEPGEFTKRAFLNGKMDLSQAEAVADLIASNSRVSHKVAMSQLRGKISSELGVLREKLLKLTALLELELDFSDHEDLEFADRSELLELAQNIQQHIERLANSFETGQAIKNGIPVAIVGKTNVGKSTLLNQLLKDDKAIVSDIHGTTRDTIEDTIDIQGITFRIIDTAGIRQTTDEVEKIGINRTYNAMEKARIVIWMMDEQANKEEMADIMEHAKGKSLIPVWNKVDINPCSIQEANVLGTPVISISAKNGQNIAALEHAMLKAANIPDLQENDTIITSARHFEALSQAKNSLDRVINAINQQFSGDLIAEDLRLTLSHLAEITGPAITPQETLNTIFQHFCVGK